MNTIVSSRDSPAKIGKIFSLVSAVVVKAREGAIGGEHTVKERKSTDFGSAVCRSVTEWPCARYLKDKRSSKIIITRFNHKICKCVLNIVIQKC